MVFIVDDGQVLDLNVSGFDGRSYLCDAAGVDAAAPGVPCTPVDARTPETQHTLVSHLATVGITGIDKNITNMEQTEV